MPHLAYDNVGSLRNAAFQAAGTWQGTVGSVVDSRVGTPLAAVLGRAEEGTS